LSPFLDRTGSWWGNSLFNLVSVFIF
jgi:hypothetical protein